MMKNVRYLLMVLVLGCLSCVHARPRVGLVPSSSRSRGPVIIATMIGFGAGRALMELLGFGDGVIKFAVQNMSAVFAWHYAVKWLFRQQVQQRLALRQDEI